MFFMTKDREPICEPLSGPPPVGGQACRPTLFLGLPEFTAVTLDQVLINDLVFSNNSKFRESPIGITDASILLQILSFLDGKSLLELTKVFGGTVILPDDEILCQTTGNVSLKNLKKLAKQSYQAIIVDDTCMIREPEITSFVHEQYEKKNTSVVIMAIEGIYDLSVLRNTFSVDWRLAAYTKRSVQLTPHGKKVIGSKAFPFKSGHRYTKAHFIQAREGEELFSEFVNPADYEYSDSETENDPVPDPSPGSPVVARVEENRSVSYFGFVNNLDVAYGAIIHRLCYASFYMYSVAAEQQAQGERKQVATRDRPEEIRQQQRAVANEARQAPREDDFSLKAKLLVGFWIFCMAVTVLDSAYKFFMKPSVKQADTTQAEL